MTERVLCAAIYIDDGKAHRGTSPRLPGTGLVYCGLRHSDCFALIQGTRPPDEDIHATIEYRREAVQGFLTTHNRFVGRAEALTLALAAEQVRSESLCVPGGTELYSEDLY